MSEPDWLAAQFEAQRSHLRTVAYRMLGSLSEADDAVQETWLRLSRSHADDVANLAGWLTTVVARVCLDMLRARKSRREQPMDEHVPEPIAGQDTAINVEQEMLLADSVGLALMVVLQTLAPAERIAFVLHDMFDLSFDEIGPIVGRSSTAARQLASRARRRVQGERNVSDSDLAGQREVVDAFLAASRGGDLNGILAVLAPEAVFRADRAAVQASASTAPSEVRDAATVAKLFSGRAQAARAALVDGAVGIVVAPRGRLFLVLRVTIEHGKIVALEAVADPARLARMELAIIA